MGINEPNQQFPSFLMPANTCYLALASGLLFFFFPLLVNRIIHRQSAFKSEHTLYLFLSFSDEERTLSRQHCLHALGQTKD